LAAAQKLFLKFIEKFQVAEDVLVELHLFGGPVVMLGVEGTLLAATVGAVAFDHLCLRRENVLGDDGPALAV
jgi:hypothetical protein